MRLGMRRLKRQRLPVIGDRCIPSTCLQQDIGKVEARNSQVRAAGNCTLIACYRFCRPLLVAADIAEIEVGEGVIASNVDRSFQMSRHIVHAVECAPRQGDVVVIFRNTIFVLDCFFNQIHGG